MNRLLRSPSAVFRLVLAIVCLAIFPALNPALAQTKTLNDLSYTKYSRKYFRPKKSLTYSLYASPVLTVDPLGIKGKSTYGFGGGGTLTLWESKSAANALQGLKLQSFYIGLGYENYPQQFDKAYFSVGLRIKTFIPIAARMERVLDIGENNSAFSDRFCLGIEIRKVTFFACGIITYLNDYVESKYANAGALMLVIPVYTHQGKFRE